jgi:hypothetical protein
VHLNQVSNRKNPIYTTLIERLPQIATNTAPPSTELQVDPRVQDPSQAPQQLTSTTLVETSAAAGSPRPESAP